MDYAPLTMQQIFDNALFGVRGQKYKSSIGPDKKFCAYRGAGDVKCGIGYSIPDAVYLPTMEKMSVTALLMRACDKELPQYEAVGVIFSKVDRPFLAKIQNAHDSMLDQDFEPVPYPEEIFEKNMLAVAVRYELKYTPPPESLT